MENNGKSVSEIAESIGRTRKLIYYAIQQL